MSNELVFKLRVDGAAVVGKDIASVGQSIDTLSASSPQAQAALAAATGQINTLGVSARQTAAAICGTIGQTEFPGRGAAGA